MNLNEYQELAQRTECDSQNAGTKSWDQQPLSTRLEHASYGLTSEVGEFADALKKWLFYGQDLDQTNLQEELGDILWYVALACNALDTPMESIMITNIAKLRKRYPEKFSEEKATEENRNREAERKILEALRKEGNQTFQPPSQAEIDTVEIPEKESCCLSDLGCEACEGKSMAVAAASEPSKNYQDLCSDCKMVRIYKKNKSGLCPDCAADRRRLNS